MVDQNCFAPFRTQRIVKIFQHVVQASRSNRDDNDQDCATTTDDLRHHLHDDHLQGKKPMRSKVSKICIWTAPPQRRASDAFAQSNVLQLPGLQTRADNVTATVISTNRHSVTCSLCASVHPSQQAYRLHCKSTEHIRAVRQNAVVNDDDGSATETGHEELRGSKRDCRKRKGQQTVSSSKNEKKAADLKQVLPSQVTLWLTETGTSSSLPTSSSSCTAICVWKNLLVPELRNYRRNASELADACSAGWNALVRASTQPHQQAVLLVCGGRFAGGVFSGRGEATKALKHKTHVRYVTRRKQGGAQITSDSRNGFAKSAGARIRRDQAAKFADDVRATLLSWAEDLARSSLVWYFAPGENRKLLFSGGGGSADSSDGNLASREGSAATSGLAFDARCRSIPFAIPASRPTYAAALAAHSRLAFVDVLSA